jgi:hypothetical protein
MTVMEIRPIVGAGARLNYRPSSLFSSELCAVTVAENLRPSDLFLCRRKKRRLSGECDAK